MTCAQFRSPRDVRVMTGCEMVAMVRHIQSCKGCSDLVKATNEIVHFTDEQEKEVARIFEEALPRFINCLENDPEAP